MKEMKLRLDKLESRPDSKKKTYTKLFVTPATISMKIQ